MVRQTDWREDLAQTVLQENIKMAPVRQVVKIVLQEKDLLAIDKHVPIVQRKFTINLTKPFSN